MSASETLTCKGSPQTHIKLSYFPWNCYPDLLNTLVYDWMKLLIILVIYKVFFYQLWALVMHSVQRGMNPGKHKCAHYTVGIYEWIITDKE